MIGPPLRCVPTTASVGSSVAVLAALPLGPRGTWLRKHPLSLEGAQPVKDECECASSITANRADETVESRLPHDRR
jgi:hypothetical protein